MNLPGGLPPYSRNTPVEPLPLVPPALALPGPGATASDHDLRLLRRMKAGDEHALGEFYDRFFPAVDAVVTRVLKTTNDIEDVIEETFSWARQDTDRFESDSASIEAWVLAIAADRTADRLKARPSAAAGPEAVGPSSDARPLMQGEIRDRLLARATAESQARRMAKPPLVLPKGAVVPPPPRIQARMAPPPRPPRSTAEWVSIGATVAFIAALAGLAVTWQQLDRAKAVAKAQESGADRATYVNDSLMAQLRQRDSLIAGVANRDISMMTMTPRVDAKDAYARVFWDRSHDTWTIFARNMPVLKPGRTYQVWIVTWRGTASAGAFDAPAGEGYIRATYSVTPDMLRAVAITEEPSGGVQQPTGETILAATVR